MSETRRSAGNGDPRAVRARAKLHAAILRIAETDSVAHASVAQVAREAAVDRSTFYAHYASVGELGLDVVKPELESFLAGLKERVVSATSPGLAVELDAFVGVIEQRRVIFADLLTAPVTGAVCADVVTTVQAQLEDMLRQVPLSIRGIQADVAASFYANAVLAVIGDWLNDHPERERRKVIASLLALMAPLVRSRRP